MATKKLHLEKDIQLQKKKKVTFFNKVAGLRCFPVSFVKFLRTPLLTKHLWWLLLQFKRSVCG